MRRSVVYALLFVWFATTGSSCQTTATGSNFQAQGEGAGVILVVLVAVGVACLTSENPCDPYEPGPFDQVQSTFETGLKMIEAGDPAGLDWVCLAARQGYAKAQYYYGVHLFRRDPSNATESLAWLSQAAAQDHKAARYMLVRMSDWREGATAAPVARPLPVSPPALRACVTRPPGAPRAPVLEAQGAPRGSGAPSPLGPSDTLGRAGS